MSLRGSALAIGGVALGAIVGAIALATDPVRAAHGWLAVGIATWSTSLGALVITMLAIVCRASWLVVVRRPFEVVIAALPAGTSMVVPALIALRAADGDPPPFLAPWVFWPRVVFELGTPLVFGELLLRRSRAQDADGASRRTSMYRTSAIGLVAIAISASLAAFDWIGGLDPVWFPNSLGMQLIASSVVAGGAAATLVAAVMWKRGDLPGLSSDHLHALGTLAFASVFGWGYLTFASYLVSYMGDLPREVRWWGPRTNGAWSGLALVLVVARFAVPFVLLLMRALKRRFASLVALSGVLLATQLVEVAWWVLPAASPGRITLSLADPAALLCALGLATLAASRMRRVATTPEGDPLLGRGLSYRTDR